MKRVGSLKIAELVSLYFEGLKKVTLTEIFNIDSFNLDSEYLFNFHLFEFIFFPLESVIHTVNNSKYTKEYREK